MCATLILKSLQFLKKAVESNVSNKLGTSLVNLSELPAFKNESNVLCISVSVDGIPIAKSGSTAFWPILGKCDQLTKPEVFVIGLFMGEEKPNNICAVIADAPARSFVKQCKNFNAFHGCERCITEGHYSGRVVYPDVSARLRCGLDYIFQKDPDHHTGTSPLVELDLDLVHNVPLDYMHLVCLGVMRIVVLKDIISDSEYVMFLRLQCAMYILLSNNASNAEWNRYASKLLHDFVLMSKELYGVEFLVYNVHNLIHIADDALTYGSLDNCSAFPFENHMQILKNMIKKNDQQVNQVAKRITERRTCGFMKAIVNEKVVIIKSSDKIIYNGITISAAPGNSCFQTSLGYIVQVKKIVFCIEPALSMLVCSILEKANLPGYVCDSDKLGIHVVKLESTENVNLHLSDLYCKCVLLPMDDVHVCIPFTKPIE
ncbi:hypothetical protein Ocin01_11931 [Orchesella cincta]|uniref:Uncharacterized protein n=1 Tax=Orchesella cincta TaxID=48709 RepID=A0A1D2MP82_ORCCI|nr:hypothetical protein Ocin01_11931 [Orchesella cincta]